MTTDSSVSPSAATPPSPQPEAPAGFTEVELLLGPLARREVQGRLWALRVQASDLHAVCLTLRKKGYDYLLLLTAVDYPAEQRMEMNYVLSNFEDGRELGLVTDVKRDDLHIATVSDIWEAADWHEREVFDLFGVRFDGHPDMRRILLDDTWEGHPLRKDYVDKGHNVIKRPY